MTRNESEKKENKVRMSSNLQFQDHKLNTYLFFIFIFTN